MALFSSRSRVFVFDAICVSFEKWTRRNSLFFGLDHEPFGAMKIFIVLASRSRSKAAGAASMPAISGVTSAAWRPPSGRRGVHPVESLALVEQASARSFLARNVRG